MWFLISSHSPTPQWCLKERSSWGVFFFVLSNLHFHSLINYPKPLSIFTPIPSEWHRAEPSWAELIWANKRTQFCSLGFVSSNTTTTATTSTMMISFVSELRQGNEANIYNFKRFNFDILRSWTVIMRYHELFLMLLLLLLLPLDRWMVGGCFYLGEFQFHIETESEPMNMIRYVQKTWQALFGKAKERRGRRRKRKHYSRITRPKYLDTWDKAKWMH